jgi:peptidoglycan/LPS O-acetylase OafA/YrhL
MRYAALYFPTPCRLDGLAIGALIATLVRERGGVAALVSAAKWLCAASIVLLGGLAWWRNGLAFDDVPTIVFGVSLLSFVAASVLVLAIRPARGVAAPNPTAKALNNPVLRSVGKFSYAMYLFHAPLEHPIAYFMPVASVTRWVGSELLACCLYVAVFIIVVYAAALISWHAYEKHWLKLKRHFEYKPESL